MIPVPSVSFSTSASFSITIPAHPSTRPLVAVAMTNESAVLLTATVGGTQLPIPPFTSRQIALDGTEQVIVVAPSASPPAISVFTAIFLEPADVNIGNDQRAGIYIPPVRLPLISQNVFTPFDGTTQTFGPFYVGDYENVVYNLQGSAPGGPNSGAWRITFTWKDQNGNTIGNISYLCGNHTDQPVIQFIDRLANLGPYLTVAISLPPGIGSLPFTQFQLQLTATRRISAGESAIGNVAMATFVGTVAANSQQQQALFPIRSTSAILSWDVGAVAWSIQILALDQSGNNYAIPASIKPANGATGIVNVAIPGRFCYLNLNNGDGTPQSMSATVTPAFS